ncbi:MAG: three-Cys-motif partner protein TcmP [Chloroflexota bacterium]
MDELADLPYLKQISRIKHQVLQDYLLPWTRILGSANPRLAYFDCFAGGGLYKGENSDQLPGSPLIALQTAKKYVLAHPDRQIDLRFVEENEATAERLCRTLSQEGGIAGSIDYEVTAEDAQTYVDGILARERRFGRGNGVPSFFFVDPFGHPVKISTMRQILSLPRTEILVNLMWYRINMDLGNRLARGRLNQLFGHEQWSSQPFIGMEGLARERSFVEYYVDQVGGPEAYCLRLRLPFSPEDRMQGRTTRTKFYLLHFSRHIRAAIVMKDIMLAAAKDIKGLQVGDSEIEQLPLFPQASIQEILIKRYTGKRLSFLEIQHGALDLPFGTSDFHAAVLALEAGRLVSIMRHKSLKKGKPRSRGLDDADIVIFS